MKKNMQLSAKKILITGASGFIGTCLLQQLKETGCEIYAISRETSDKKNDRVHWVKGDVSDIHVLRKIFTNINPQIVFHLASHVTGKREMDLILPTYKYNLLSTINLLTLVTEFKCERLITIGSMEEPDSGSNDVPCSPYSAAKWASTGYSRMFYQLYQTPVVILRLFMVYGPNQKDSTKLIPYTITSLLKGEQPRLSSGKRNVDWIYIDDVVDALIKSATTPGIEGNIIEIGSGQMHRVKSVVEKLVKIVNPHVLPLFNDVADRPMEQSRTANISESKKLISWQPLVSLDDGLAKTVAWYKNEKKYEK